MFKGVKNTSLNIFSVKTNSKSYFLLPKSLTLIGIKKFIFSLQYSNFSILDKCISGILISKSKQFLKDETSIPSFTLGNTNSFKLSHPVKTLEPILL